MSATIPDFISEVLDTVESAKETGRIGNETAARVAPLVSADNGVAPTRQIYGAILYWAERNAASPEHIKARLTVLRDTRNYADLARAVHAAGPLSTDNYAHATLEDMSYQGILGDDFEPSRLSLAAMQQHAANWFAITTIRDKFVENLASAAEVVLGEE